MIEGGRRASERNRKAKEPAESSDTHAWKFCGTFLDLHNPRIVRSTIRTSKIHIYIRHLSNKEICNTNTRPRAHYPQRHFNERLGFFQFDIIRKCQIWHNSK
jgi:hypothetical protein